MGRNRHQFWTRSTVSDVPRFGSVILPLLWWAGFKQEEAEHAIADTVFRHESLKRLDARLQSGKIVWLLPGGRHRRSLLDRADTISSVEMARMEPPAGAIDQVKVPSSPPTTNQTDQAAVGCGPTQPGLLASVNWRSDDASPAIPRDYVNRDD